MPSLWGKPNQRSLEPWPPTATQRCQHRVSPLDLTKAWHIKEAGWTKAACGSLKSFHDTCNSDIVTYSSSQICYCLLKWRNHSLWHLISRRRSLSQIRGGRPKIAAQYYVWPCYQENQEGLNGLAQDPSPLWPCGQGSHPTTLHVGTRPSSCPSLKSSPQNYSNEPVISFWGNQGSPLSLDPIKPASPGPGLFTLFPSDPLIGMQGSPPLGEYGLRCSLCKNLPTSTPVPYQVSWVCLCCVPKAAVPPLPNGRGVNPNQRFISN